MSEPIPVQITRFRCPSCLRMSSSRSRAREHMTRCWFDPANRGCKTCRLFFQDQGDGDFCDAGVDLSGRSYCKRCDGMGFTADGADLGHPCPECDNDPEQRDEVKGGPVIHCDLWQNRDEEPDDA